MTSELEGTHRQEPTSADHASPNTATGTLRSRWAPHLILIGALGTALALLHLAGLQLPILQERKGYPPLVVSPPRLSSQGTALLFVVCVSAVAVVLGAWRSSLWWRTTASLVLIFAACAGGLTATRDPWVTTPLAPKSGIFGAESEWRRDIGQAPVADNSGAQVADLAGQVERYYGEAAFNVFDYNATLYTVAPGAPRSDVVWDDCQGKGYVPPQLYTRQGEPGYEGAHFRDVPLPPEAVTSVGSDKSIAVYDPDTDQLWEFWIAEKKADGWHACWGGRLDSVSKVPGFFSNGMGSSATGLPTAGGMIRMQEVEAGHIDHALSLAIVDTENFDRFSYPAQRSDGNNPEGRPDAIAEGTRFRLDPTLDVDALNLHPLATMVAKAAQQYGFIVTDKAGAVSVIAESGAGVQAVTGRNPWGDRQEDGSLGPGLLDGTEAYSIMNGFPWDHLQALPQDYKKP